MVLRFCIKLFSCMLNAEANCYHYLLLESVFGCWEYFFFPQCCTVEKCRNCRSFINALLHCSLNPKQMGQDALAKILCEHADLQRAFHFQYGNAETGPGHWV